MARQILPIAGAVVGAFFGNPQLGYMIGSLVGNVVDPQVLKGPRIGDIGVQTSRDGVPRPIVFGTAAVTGNVIDRGKYIKTIVEEQQGKGGPVIESEKVQLTFAIRICEGPITGISRIWEDEKLVYDSRPSSLILADSSKYARGFEIYGGTETQLPDPSLEVIHGVGTTPAYRGTAYIVFNKKDLTERRGSIPSYRFEVVGGNDFLNPVSGDTWFLSNYSKLHTSVDGGITWNPASHPGLSYVSNPLLNWHQFCGVNVIAGINEVGTYYKINPSNPIIPISYTTTSISGSAYAITRFTRSRIDQLVAYNFDALTLDGGVTIQKMEQTLLAGDSRLYGVTRTASGRWIGFGAFSGYASVYAFCYTNQLVPTASGWQYLSVLPSGNNPSIGQHCIAANAYCVLVSSPAGIYRSSDNGANWEVVFAGVVSDYIFPLRGAAWLAAIPSGASAGLWRTINNGTTWTQVSTGLFTDQPNSMDFDGDSTITIFTDTVGAYVSRDFGLNWSPLISPIACEFATSPTFLSNAGYSVTPIAGDPYPLSEIVKFCCDRAGLDATEIDVSELTDDVTGFVIAGTYSATEAIRSLQRVYFFDAGEWDGILRFVKRGGEVIELLTEDDFLDSADETIREQELEFPRKLHLSYQDAALGYAPTKQTVTRSSPDIRVVGETGIEVPVVLSADQAAQAVEKMMKTAWVDTGGEVKFKMPDNKSYITATDCLNLTIRDRTIRVRVERVDVADGALEVQARHDRQSSYTSNAVGAIKPDPFEPVSSLPGVTYFEFMNIPALQDSDDKLGYYVAVRGELPAWQGCLLERSIDGGATYSSVGNFTRSTLMGGLLDALPSASPYVLDTTNQIRFEVYGVDNYDMPSLTYAQMLQENNACLVGDEIIQYQDAVEESSGVWVLSNLIRGRLTTPCESHAIGSRFVFLQGCYFIEASSSLVSSSLTHRVTSYGNSAEESATYTDLWDPANSQIEFAPLWMELERVGDIIKAKWSPRYRFGTSASPVQSINDKGFRVTFSDGTNSVTPPDNYDALSSYDVTGWASPVTVTVQPINRITQKSGPKTTGVIA